MVVIHVINSLCVGGIEKVVVDISNNQALLGNKVYIITLSNSNFKLKIQLNPNVEVISLPYKNNSVHSILLFWIFGIPKTIKIINRIKPNIIHSHLYYHYFLFLSLSIKFSNVFAAHFRTIHTSGLFYNSTTLLNRFRLLIEKVATKIYPVYLIGVSKQIFENNKSFFSLNANEIRLIPNGIDLKEFSKSHFTTITKSDFGINNNTIIVTYVSRLDNGKNHYCLFNSWFKVVKVCANVHLCIVGDGNLKNTLIKQTQVLGIEKYVSFLGNLDNVAPFLSITDIGVFPSHFEGFPVSLIEKLAMELPVITSDINVFKDVIVNNENGFICSVNDSNDYANKLILLLENPELRIKLGKTAKELSRKYDIIEITKQTLSFYEEALSI